MVSRNYVVYINDSLSLYFYILNKQCLNVLIEKQ